MGSEPHFTARLEQRNDIVRIALRGEIDMSTAPILADSLSLAGADGADAILVDMRDLSFIDSSGLLALLQARERAEGKGQQLLVVGTPPFARRLFEVTRTEFLLDREATELFHRFSGGQALGADQISQAEAGAGG